AGFFLVGIHAPLTHVMPEHKISDTPLLRSPTRGKPARHNKPAGHNNPLTTKIRPFRENF
ncbi:MULTISPECIES: hypothetical protein, partial [unclassified Pseudomonas]|uniref:hypothetical protein n=1 Tax=unclassified Pseudomonas TaxID=196821 RepID=UPI001C44C315